MVYFVSYIVFIAGLIWYNKISSMVDKNIQITLDKQYPDLERLWSRTTSNSEQNGSDSDSDKGVIEYFDNSDQADQKIINLPKKCAGRAINLNFCRRDSS
jgi:hypothetical protein